MIIQLILHVISAVIVILYIVIFSLSTGGKRDRTPPFENLNILVPTYNEAETIAECLESLLEMDANLPHKIYVLDDNSSDGTPGIVSRYSDRVSLLERSARTSKADALNHALQNLEGDVFAVVDADCIVGREWLSQLVCPLSDDSVGISTGSILVKNRNSSILTRLQSCEMAFLCHQLLRPVEKVGMLYSINGNNFAFTRSCWEKVGGFDPTKLTEDTDFAIRTRRSGLDIRFANARVFTRVPARLGDLLRQRRRWYIGWYQDLSSASLFGGAIFILLFYYAFIFFIATFSIFSAVFFIIYYLELSATFHKAYGKIDVVNPLVFIILAPFLTTATIITALPSVLKGKKNLALGKHW